MYNIILKDMFNAKSFRGYNTIIVLFDIVSPMGFLKAVVSIFDFYITAESILDF